jgi:hypothetical protein
MKEVKIGFEMSKFSVAFMRVELNNRRATLHELYTNGNLDAVTKATVASDMNMLAEIIDFLTEVISNKAYEVRKSEITTLDKVIEQQKSK